jgi:TPR repeat protein
MKAIGNVAKQECGRWLNNRAENSHQPFRRGIMYANGQGVPQDYVQAHMWFNLAASRSSVELGIVEAVKNRGEIAEMMTPAQIAEAQRLAREWKPK